MSSCAFMSGARGEWLDGMVGLGRDSESESVSQSVSQSVSDRVTVFNERERRERVRE